MFVRNFEFEAPASPLSQSVYEAETRAQQAPRHQSLAKTPEPKEIQRTESMKFRLPETCDPLGQLRLDLASPRHPLRPLALAPCPARKPRVNWTSCLESIMILLVVVLVGLASAALAPV